MTTPSTNKCCEKQGKRCAHGGIMHTHSPSCHKPTEPRDFFLKHHEQGTDGVWRHKPTEPSVCLAQVMVGDYPSTCGLPRPCKDHGWREAVAEEQKKDAEVGRKVREEESPWRETKEHVPSEEKKLIDRQMNQIIDNHKLASKPLFTPQQEEASWEAVIVNGVDGDALYIQDFRVGGPKPLGGAIVKHSWMFNPLEVPAIKALLQKKDEEIAQAEKRGEVRALEWVMDSVYGEPTYLAEVVRNRLTALREPHT